MEPDNRDDEDAVCSVTVPFELVNVLIGSMLDTIEKWCKENDMQLDLEMSGGAIMVASDMIMTRFFGGDNEETVQ